METIAIHFRDFDLALSGTVAVIAGTLIALWILFFVGKHLKKLPFFNRGVRRNNGITPAQIIQMLAKISEKQAIQETKAKTMEDKIRELKMDLTTRLNKLERKLDDVLVLLATQQATKAPTPTAKKKSSGQEKK